MGRLKRGRHRSRRAFNPWRADFLTAYAAAGLAAYALIRGVLLQTPTGMLAGAGLAAALGWFAVTSWRTARSRWYGQQLEAWATDQVGRLLDRRKVSWVAGHYVPGLGDIDLMVQGKKATAVVEIKSFNRWHQGLFRIGRREQAAIEQAGRQLETVGADLAMVWLPRGRPTLGQRIFGAGTRHVRVVFGPPSRLARKLRKV